MIQASKDSRNQAKMKPKSLLIKENIQVYFMELWFLKISTSVNMAKILRLKRKMTYCFIKPRRLNEIQ